jgi:hypothetical protein
VSDPKNGIFRYPVNRKFVDAVDRVLAKYHFEAEADFEGKKKAGEDTSKHVIQDVMKVLSEMASAQPEFEAYRTGERQVRDILAALVGFIREFPDEWRTSDDKVEWDVSHSRHQLVNHVFSALLSVDSLLGGEHEIPADVRRFLTLHVNAKDLARAQLTTPPNGEIGKHAAQRRRSGFNGGADEQQ